MHEGGLREKKACLDLGFQSEPSILLVCHPCLAREGTVQLVAAVELQARGGGKDFQGAPRSRGMHAGRQTQPVIQQLITEGRWAMICRDSLLLSGSRGGIEL